MPRRRTDADFAEEAALRALEGLERGPEGLEGLEVESRHTVALVDTWLPAPHLGPDCSTFYPAGAVIPG
jgi:hypothetical protein